MKNVIFILTSIFLFSSCATTPTISEYFDQQECLKEKEKIHRVIKTGDDGSFDKQQLEICCYNLLQFSVPYKGGLEIKFESGDELQYRLYNSEKIDKIKSVAELEEDFFSNPYGIEEDTSRYHFIPEGGDYYLLVAHRENYDNRECTSGKTTYSITGRLFPFCSEEGEDWVLSLDDTQDSIEKEETVCHEKTLSAEVSTKGILYIDITSKRPLECSFEEEIKISKSSDDEDFTYTISKQVSPGKYYSIKVSNPEWETEKNLGEEIDATFRKAISYEIDLKFKPFCKDDDRVENLSPDSSQEGNVCNDNVWKVQVPEKGTLYIDVISEKELKYAFERKSGTTKGKYIESLKPDQAEAFTHGLSKSVNKHGTYYVRVFNPRGKAGEEIAYEIRSNLKTEKPPEEEMCQDRSEKRLTFGSEKNAAVCFHDKWKVWVPEEGRLEVTLGNSELNYVIKDSSDNTIIEGTGPLPGINVSRGNYYIHIYNKDNEDRTKPVQPYTILAKFSSTPPACTDNEQQVLKLGSSQKGEGKSSVCFHDIWKINIPEEGKLKISLTDCNPSKLKYAVYKKIAEPKSGYLKEGSVSPLEEAVKKGSYYIHVYNKANQKDSKKNPAESYTLMAEFLATPPPPPEQSCNDDNKLKELTPGDSGNDGHICFHDIWKLTISKKGTLKFTVNDSELITVLSKDKTEPFKENSGPSELDVSKGEIYYLHVYNKDNQTDPKKSRMRKYTISTKISSPPLACKNIGTVDKNQSVPIKFSDEAVCISFTLKAETEIANVRMSLPKDREETDHIDFFGLFENETSMQEKTGAKDHSRQDPSWVRNYILKTGREYFLTIEKNVEKEFDLPLAFKLDIPVEEIGELREDMSVKIKLQSGETQYRSFTPIKDAKIVITRPKDVTGSYSNGVDLKIFRNKPEAEKNKNEIKLKNSGKSTLGSFYADAHHTYFLKIHNSSKEKDVLFKIVFEPVR
jgi:hypothetical protein